MGKRAPKWFAPASMLGSPLRITRRCCVSRGIAERQEILARLTKTIVGK